MSKHVRSSRSREEYVSPPQSHARYTLPSLQPDRRNSRERYETSYQYSPSLEQNSPNPRTHFHSTSQDPLRQQQQHSGHRRSNDLGPPQPPPKQPANAYQNDNTNDVALHAYPDADISAVPTYYASQQSTSNVTPTKTSRQPKMVKARRRLGLNPTVPVTDEHDEAPHSDLLWSRIKLVLREPFSEFWGVFIMVLFGDGSVAQVILSAGQTSAPGGNGFGAYQSISWGWGLGVMLGIYVAGDSGAYLNPAVTFCSCLYRKLPWRRFPLYFIAQVLGAFAGSGVVYANYKSAIDNVEGYNVRTVPPSATATAGIFCTYPQAFLTKTGQFFSEFIASAILMFVIFALKDDANMGSGKGDKWFPLALFFLIFGLGACFGWETGYAINLARDFGPRLMSYAVGYGNEVWSAGGYYFWIPMVAPFIGCTFGGFLYDAFIYTGESPVNTPWLGLKRLIHPREAVKARRERNRRQKVEGIV